MEEGKENFKFKASYLDFWSLSIRLRKYSDLLILRSEILRHGIFEVKNVVGFREAKIKTERVFDAKIN